MTTNLVDSLASENVWAIPPPSLEVKLLLLTVIIVLTLVRFNGGGRNCYHSYILVVTILIFLTSSTDISVSIATTRSVQSQVVHATVSHWIRPYELNKCIYCQGKKIFFCSEFICLCLYRTYTAVISEWILNWQLLPLLWYMYICNYFICFMFDTLPSNQNWTYDMRHSHANCLTQLESPIACAVMCLMAPSNWTLSIMCPLDDGFCRLSVYLIACGLTWQI